MECTSKDYFAALGILVKPADAGSTGDLHDILQLNICQVLEKLGIDDIGALPTLRHVHCYISEKSSVRWKFVCVMLHVLISLKECLMKQAAANPGGPNQAPGDLLSVSQQKTIKTCLQFVVSMGLLPSLLPGVGISMAARCNNVKKLKEEDLVVLEKYERLAGVARALLVCCEQPSLRAIVLEEHLGDMMAALSQLSFVPLKKPTAASPATATDDFHMTAEIWAKLQEDRGHFKSYYLTFVAQVYQPLVIKELLLLQGSAGSKAGLKTRPPGWLKRACVQLLVQCLMRDGGVSAMIRAICQLSPLDIAEEWIKLDTVVRLITTAHSLQEDVYYKCIGRQMIEMLSLKEDQQNSLLTRVAVLCIKSLSENKPKMCRRYLLNVMMTPLLLCTYNPDEGVTPAPAAAPTTAPTTTAPAPAQLPDTLNLFTGPDSHMVVRIHSATLLATEAQVTQCILNLYTCFVAPTSAINALSPDLLWLVAPVLFRLHQKLYRSASYLKNYVQDLLLRFMSSCVQEKLHQAFGAFLFGDSVSGMVAFSDHVELEFGPGGGVQVVLRSQPANQDVPWSEEAGHCLLELLEQGDKMGDMTNVLFVSLLHMLSDPDNETEASCSYMQCSNSDLVELEDVLAGMVGASKNMVTIKFLMVLAGNATVQDRLHAEPGPIVRFLQFLLEREARLLAVDPARDPDRLHTIVMILGILISGNSEAVRTHWDSFKGLQEPLKAVAESLTDGETRDLASRMYNTIVSHGVVSEATPPTEKPHDACGKKCRAAGGAGRYVAREGGACKVALQGVTDASVPARGHALLELAKLIHAGDQEAHRNRNHILRIFQENLKHEDSYIYLSCINGLGVMAHVFPNTVVQTLVEELATLRMRKDPAVSDPADLMVKIGEVLVRVTKQLGDFVPTYKTMLLNAFLLGTRDPDELVRASSLSNLGQVCQALGFRVGNISSEILMCVRHIVASDESYTVRRAAIMVITLLLQGLGQDTHKVLGHVMLCLYRTLKLVYQKESDPTLRQHCQMALEELNKSTLAFLFPPCTLEKQLYVLTPPP